MKAMTNAWKYAERYGYPDGNIVQAIADHHGVKPENILLTAGSGEVLDVVGTTFLQGGKKVLGVDPSYGSVYQHATSIKSDAIKLPLTKDYRQDIGMIIDAAKKHARPSSASSTSATRTTRPADRDGQGSQAAARRHPDGPCRSSSTRRTTTTWTIRLRHVDAVRERRPSGRHRADLLEDRGPGRDAHRLRRRADRD